MSDIDQHFEIYSLERTIADLQDEVETLKSDVNYLEEDVRVAKDDVADLQYKYDEELATSTDRLDQLELRETYIAKMESEADALTTALQDLRTGIMEVLGQGI